MSTQTATLLGRQAQIDTVLEVEPQRTFEHRIPRLRIAVFTIDAVHYHEIAKLGEEAGYAVDQMLPKEPYPEDRLYRLDIYDLDFWRFAPGERRAFVNALTSRRLRRRTIVQSYGLSDAEIDQLRAHGVIVVRHLSAANFVPALYTPTLVA